MKESKKQAASYIFQIANGIIPIAFILLMYAVYSFEVMSYYFIALSTSGLILMAVDFGFNITPIRDLEKLDSAKVYNDFSRKFKAISYGKLLLSFALFPFLILFSYSSINPFSNSILFSIYVISVLTSISNIQWFLFVLNKSIEFASILLVFRVLSVVVIFLLYLSLFKATIEQTSLFLLSIPLISNIIVLVKYKKLFGIQSTAKSVGLSDIVMELKRSSKIFLNSSFDVAVKAGWPITLFALSGSKELVSVYGLIERAVKAVYLLFSPLPFFLLANSFYLVRWRDISKKILEKKLVFYGVIAFILGPFLIYFSILVYDFSDHSFFEGYRLSIIAVYLFQPYLLIANLLIYTFLVHQNRELLLTFAIVIAVISLIFLSFIQTLPIVLYPFFYDLVLVIVLIIFILKADFKVNCE